MHDDLRSKVSEDMPRLVELLGRLVRLPTVSAAGYDRAQVRAGAEQILGLLAEAGFSNARLLEAEARLRRLFAGGSADASAVRAAVAEVEQARTALRLVHLLAHLETHALLTEAQRRAYHEARWPER